MFDDLESALDNTDYTPSFAPRQQTRKPLNRMASPAVSQPPLPSKTYTPPAEQAPPRRPGTLLGLHKASSMESKSEERTVPNKPTTPNKDWDIPLPDLEFRPTSRNAPITAPAAQEETPATMQRGMRPPLSRKGSQKSLGVGAETTNLHTTNMEFNQTVKFSDNELGKIKEMYEEQMKSLKEFYQKQLKTQRTLFETRLKESKEQFESSKAAASLTHKEQLKLKLQLKDVQLEKLKEMQKIELQTKSDQLKQIQKLRAEGEKLSKKEDIVEQWEKRLKFETDGLAKKQEERLDKTRRELDLREKNVSERQKEVETKEKQWREQLKKQKKLIEGQYQRLQNLQENIVKDKNKIERDFLLKQQTMKGQIEEIKRQHQKKIQDLQLLKSNLEHQKSLLKDSQTYYQNKISEFNTERQDLLKNCDEDKRRISQKQIELQGKLRAIIVRQSEIDYLKDQLKSKTQLLQLERKRATLEVEAKQKPQGARDTLMRTFYNKDLEQRAKNVERANSQIKKQPSVNKSLTQLKNAYLNGLQQSRGQGTAPSGFRPFTFNNFK